MKRRNFLHLSAAAAAFPVLPRLARAQAYPARPVHLIVGFPPGGGTFIRVSGDKMMVKTPGVIVPMTGQTSVVEFELVKAN